MSDVCLNCGRTRFEAIAEAKTLGLEQELLGGLYTCCQIGEWADEQLMAWLDATCDDGKSNVEKAPTLYEPVDLVELGETEEIFVHVRTRRQRVPWFRDPNELR